MVGVAPTTAGDTRPLDSCSLVAKRMVLRIMGFCGIRISYGNFTIAYFGVNRILPPGEFIQQTMFAVPSHQILEFLSDGYREMVRPCA